jgi:hypothetical protein
MFGILRELAVGHLAWTLAVVTAMLTGFGLALALWLKGRDGAAVGCVAAGVAVVFLAYLALVMPVIDEVRSHKQFAADVMACVSPGDLLVANVGEDHELCYLLDRPVVVRGASPTGALWSAGESCVDALRRARAAGRGAYLIVLRHQAAAAGPGFDAVAEESPDRVKSYVLLSYEPTGGSP